MASWESESCSNFPPPPKKQGGSGKNDDIFGFRPMEVLGTKTPAFCFEVKFVYISCTNVENYLPSNNFGYRTIFMFFCEKGPQTETPKYMMFRFGCLQSGPHTMVINGLKKPLKNCQKKTGNRGDISPR